MTTFVNAGDFPVAVGGLIVGVNASVTRTARVGALPDGEVDPFERFDREGTSVVLFPGDTVDTDVEILSRVLVELDENGSPVPDPDAEPVKPKRNRAKNTPADESAPTETE